MRVEVVFKFDNDEKDGDDALAYKVEPWENVMCEIAHSVLDALENEFPELKLTGHDIVFDYR